MVPVKMETLNGAILFKNWHVNGMVGIALRRRKDEARSSPIR